jgi:hypothetical protein
MAKKDKTPDPTDKIYSLEDMDEATLKQFNQGVLVGTYKCHTVMDKAVRRLRQSLEDVWAIEYNGVITPEKKERADKLAFATETLIVLTDMFQDDYFEHLDKLKARLSPDEDFYIEDDVIDEDDDD